MTHPLLTHPNGDQCIWIDATGWFVPLDAGGEGHACPHAHPYVDDRAMGQIVDEATERMLASPRWAEFVRREQEHGARRERERAERYRDLFERLLSVHEQVVMDTPEDRELHARAIETFRAARDSFDPPEARGL